MGTMRSNNNIVYVCRYHVVFCPKYRRNVLMPPIDERLKVILAEQMPVIGQDLQLNEVLPDHVHLLVGCDPQFGIHRLVKLQRGELLSRLARGVPRAEAAAPFAVDQFVLLRDDRRRHAGNTQTLRAEPKGQVGLGRPWPSRRVRKTYKFKLKPTPEQERLF